MVNSDLHNCEWFPFSNTGLICLSARWNVSGRGTLTVWYQLMFCAENQAISWQSFDQKQQELSAYITKLCSLNFLSFGTPLVPESRLTRAETSLIIASGQGVHWPGLSFPFSLADIHRTISSMSFWLSKVLSCFAFCFSDAVFLYVFSSTSRQRTPFVIR